MSDTVEVPTGTAPARSIGAPEGSFIGVFYGQLAGMLKAGMPLPYALRTLAKETRSARFRNAMERVADSVESGIPAAQAFREEEVALGGLLGRVAAATSASGNLAAMLSELSAWCLAQDRIRRRIREAVLYPFTILFVASLMTTAFVNFGNLLLGSDPRNIAKELDLDYQTNIIDALVPFLCYGSLGLTVGILLLTALARIYAPLRAAQEYLYINLPGFGAVCRPLALSRFCGSVAILMKAGTPYHEAVLASGELSGFEPYAKAARRVAATLAAGGAQADAWPDLRLFPASLRFILASAEQRGDTPNAFKELAELYQIEAEARGRVLAMILPPISLVAVGALVSCFMYAVISPLLQLLRILG